MPTFQETLLANSGLATGTMLDHILASMGSGGAAPSTGGGVTADVASATVSADVTVETIVADVVLTLSASVQATPLTLDYNADTSAEVS